MWYIPLLLFLGVASEYNFDMIYTRKKALSHLYDTNGYSFINVFEYIIRKIVNFRSCKN